MEKSLAWSKATKGIWQGVLGYVLLSAIGSVIAVVASFRSTVSQINDFAGGGKMSSSTLLDTLPIIISVLGILCGLLIISNLAKWRDLVDAQDAPYVARIRTAFMLNIVALVVGILPIPMVAAIISGILCIVSFFMQMTAYSTLKNSQTLPAAAANGMGKLFTSTILSLVAVLLGFIPFLGVLGLIVSIVAFVFMLIGWYKVGNSRI